MSNIVQATPDDYEEMVTTGNLCFGLDRGVLEKRWCHVWGGHLQQPSADYMQNFFLYRRDGCIWGMLAVVPMVLEWDDEKIDTGGISAAATHPQYRKKGVMSELLTHADSMMQTRGDIISVLGGDRQRYGHFGWEHIGVRPVLVFGKKYLDSNPQAQLDPVRITADSSQAVLDAVVSLHDQISPRFQRIRADLAVHLMRPAIEFWATLKNGLPVCYIGAFDHTIHEYGGDHACLPGLIKHFAMMHSTPEINLAAPPVFCRAEELLFKSAGRIRTTHLCSLKTLQFRALMQKLLPAIRRTARPIKTPAFSASLELKESGEKIILNAGAAGIDLVDRNNRTTGATHCTLCLPRRDMARLLFGPFAEGVLAATDLTSTQAASLLDIFPLKIRASLIDIV